MNEEYVKDFDKWNKVKSETNSRNIEDIVIQEGAVWLMRVGVNVGFEIDGKGKEFVRPVIIIRKINDSMFFGIPVSSKETEDFFRVGFDLLGERRVAKLSQIRSFDKKRLVRLMAMLPTKDLELVTERILEVFKKARGKDETPQPSTTIEGNLGCP